MEGNGCGTKMGDKVVTLTFAEIEQEGEAPDAAEQESPIKGLLPWLSGWRACCLYVFALLLIFVVFLLVLSLSVIMAAVSLFRLICQKPNWMAPLKSWWGYVCLVLLLGFVVLIAPFNWRFVMAFSMAYDSLEAFERPLSEPCQK